MDSHQVKFKVKKYISYSLKVGTLLSTAGLIFSIIIQIYSRFFMESAPSWTEEASRFFFVYAISFSAGLAYQQNYFVFLDLISKKLSKQNDQLMEVIVNLLVFILFLVIAIFSMSFIKLGLSEKSPSLGVNMAVAFSSMLLLALSICYFSGIKLLQLMRRKL